ncbi:hypothetical protein, partial [Bradyrhizobium sp.]|uniref:hypothetical protein n=1 Tax=Bradyrhizobium sp. TaxID=376 RepID=UPI00261F0181
CSSFGVGCGFASAAFLRASASASARLAAAGSGPGSARTKDDGEESPVVRFSTMRPSPFPTRRRRSYLNCEISKGDSYIWHIRVPQVG